MATLNSEAVGHRVGGDRVVKVQLNGKEREVPDGLTVEDFLKHLDLHPQRVAVELNREIVKRARFGETQRHSNDSIEILQFVGGG